MTSVGVTRRRRLAAVAALLCALVVTYAVAVPVAAAEAGEGTEAVEVSWPGFPTITGPSSPEEYEYRLHLSSEQIARQAGDQIIVEYLEGPIAYRIESPFAHDAVGAEVPVTIALSEGDVMAIVVHHREGNPAAGGAPFAYPITDGPGWEGGYRTISVELTERNPPAATPPTSALTCSVPSLRGLSLRTAKTRLRAADCSIGQVHRTPGATKAKGKVVKQFRPSGTQLEAGALVAVKLGSR